jgi:cellulose synthase/poly-beta-1,6-N-acetylglucosamine synthase-like glycosyltransferase
VRYKKWKTHTNSSDPDIERYIVWLYEQEQKYSSHGQEQQRFDYRQLAQENIAVSKKNLQPFAPFVRGRSAYDVVLPWQVVLIFFILLFFGYFYSYSAIFFAILSVIFIFLRTHSSLSIDEHLLLTLEEAAWPSYTILFPILSGENVHLPYFDYPADKLQIIFLSEDELEVPEPAHFLLVPRCDISTRARLCNYGLLYATGQYIVVYEAQDIPDPLQLKKVVLTFAQKDLACVETFQFFRSKHFFAIENLLFPIKKTLHLKTMYLRALGGWDAFTMAEDIDIVIRLSSYGFSTELLASFTQKALPISFASWFYRRSLWIQGVLQAYLVGIRAPKNRKTFFLLHYFLLNLFFLYFPYFWCLFFLGKQWIILVVLGMNVLRLFIHAIRERSWLVFLFPLYWIVVSFAMIYAFYCLCIRRNEKTKDTTLTTTARIRALTHQQIVQPKRWRL